MRSRILIAKKQTSATHKTMREISRMSREVAPAPAFGVDDGIEVFGMRRSMKSRNERHHFPSVWKNFLRKRSKTFGDLSLAFSSASSRGMRQLNSGFAMVSLIERSSSETSIDWAVGTFAGAAKIE